MIFVEYPFENNIILWRKRCQLHWRGSPRSENDKALLLKWQIKNKDTGTIDTTLGIFKLDEMRLLFYTLRNRLKKIESVAKKLKYLTDCAYIRK